MWICKLGDYELCVNFKLPGLKGTSGWTSALPGTVQDSTGLGDAGVSFTALGHYFAPNFPPESSCLDVADTAPTGSVILSCGHTSLFLHQDPCVHRPINVQVQEAACHLQTPKRSTQGRFLTQGTDIYQD